MFFRRTRTFTSGLVLLLAVLARIYRASMHIHPAGAERGHTGLVYDGPSSVSADDYLRDANAALEAKNLEGSLQALDEAIRLEPNRPDSYVHRAIVHELNRDHDLAIGDCTEAINLNGTNALAFYVRGCSYANKGDHVRAVQDLTTSLEFNPADRDCRLRRGKSFAAKKDEKRALADFDDAIRLNPHKADAYVERGRLYEGKKDYDQASADYAQAIVVERDDPTAYSDLAWIYATCPKAALRNGKMAVEYARYACQRTEWKRPEAMTSLAAAYAETGQFTEAVTWAKRALAAMDAQADVAAAGQLRKQLKCYEVGKPFRAD